MKDEIAQWLSAETAIDTMAASGTPVTFAAKLKLMLQRHETPKSGQTWTPSLVTSSEPQHDLVNYERVFDAQQWYQVDTTCSLLSAQLRRFVLCLQSRCMNHFIRRPPVTELQEYTHLRSEQNKAWALATVQSGIDYVAKGENDRAIKAYRHAIEIDANCREAHFGSSLSSFY